MSSRLFCFVIVIVVVTAACGSRVEQSADGTSSSATSGSGGAGGSSGCPGSAPLCADGCGSDYFPHTASCNGTSWQCPEGTVLPDDCPAGTCWGLPLPGEVCGPNGWACEPELETLLECSGLICATCNGFDGPINTTDCHCACGDDGQVVCNAVANPACDGLEFCECHGRPDCEPQTDTCICHCDYMCPGEEPCDCDCGGGQYLGCAAIEP